jgi:hypothetical protein|eukprot:Stramenopile-MAST_4_protein_1867
MTSKKPKKSPAFPPRPVSVAIASLRGAAAFDDFSLESGTGTPVMKKTETSFDEENEEMNVEKSDDETDTDIDEQTTEAPMGLDAAAALLMSVSPRFIPMRPRSLSHLEPLESLSSLADAAFEQPNSEDVEKLRTCMEGIAKQSSSGMGSLLSFNSKGTSKQNDFSPNTGRGTKILFRLSRSGSSENGSNHSKDTEGKKRKFGLSGRTKKEPSTKSSSGNSKRRRLEGASIPSTLKDTKYANDYYVDGRIGIYTPEQRAQLLEKFRNKRRNRVWFKKVRYGCRKNLADRRLRIKGRFVRQDSQEYKDYFANLAREQATGKKLKPMDTIKEDVQDDTVSSFSLQTGASKSNDAIFGSEDAPEMSSTAFSILAKRNGRPRAASMLY